MKPIGVSSYELTRALPKSLQSVLPTVEQIEAELSTLDAAKQPAISSGIVMAVFLLAAWN